MQISVEMRRYIRYNPSIALHDTFIYQKEGNKMPTEKEIKIIEKAAIYDLRRLLKTSGKESYTVEELCNLLDTIADAKDQE